MDDVLKASGEFELVLRGPDGKIKQTVKKRKLLVTTGKEGIADQLAATPSLGVPKYISVGKSSTAAAAGDTALGEQDGSRKEATTRTRSAKVLTMAVEYTAGEHTATLKEAGIHSATSAGTMYSHTVFEA